MGRAHQAQWQRGRAGYPIPMIEAQSPSEIVVIAALLESNAALAEYRRAMIANKGIDQATRRLDAAEHELRRLHRALDEETAAMRTTDLVGATGKKFND